MNQKTTLGLIGLLIIFIGTGVYLSEGIGSHRELKIIENQQKDGPYLIYNDEGIESISGQIEEGAFKEKKELIPNSESLSSSHRVTIPSLRTDFAFQIQEDPLVPHFQYAQHPRIFTISDVEGDFEFMKKILMTNGVMDKNFKWSYGDGHLVILGDSFDRGEWVTESLWLMYKLDYESKSAGGQVHFIIGNHETMAMSGDDRYIHKKYQKVTESLDRKYASLYSDKTVIGQWLRTKNSIEIIGNTLFVHGGLSPVLSASDLSVLEINDIVREGIDKIGKSNLTASERLVLGSDGPLWFRDYVDQKIDQNGLISILERFGVEHIIIGHTVVERIRSLYNTGVYAIDVDRAGKTVYEALLIENGKFFRVTSEKDKEPI